MGSKISCQANGTPTVNIDGVEIEILGDEYSERMVRALSGGSYERRERAILKRAIAAGDRILELGAATGLIAMLAARIVGPQNVIAFEANPRMIDRAKQNFVRNGLHDIRLENAILQNATLWKGPGSKVKFYIASDFWSSRAVQGANTVDVVFVPSQCLEEVIRDNQINVLICDIEGGEIDLLMNAEVMQIKTIMFETHREFVGEEATNQLIDRLIKCGFGIDATASEAGVVLMHRGVSS
jgi:FkbM family methyltransferase